MRRQELIRPAGCFSRIEKGRVPFRGRKRSEIAGGRDERWEAGPGRESHMVSIVTEFTVVESTHHPGNIRAWLVVSGRERLCGFFDLEKARRVANE